MNLSNRRFETFSIICFSLLTIILVSGCASSATQAQAQVAVSSQQTQPSTTQLNPIATAVQQMGDNQCTAQVNQVTNFIGFNQNSGAVLMTNQQQPANQRLIPVVMEQPVGKGTALISATFAPTTHNCNATYDAYAIWGGSCKTVAETKFGQLTAQRQLKKNITVLDGGSQLKVFLMQAGDMCVSVKKETIN